jgi:DNA-binding NarL/FixJ family response regulator
VPEAYDREPEDVRVLVIEDQATVREALAATFAGEPGFEVAQAGSLADARAMLDGVDIATVDLGLPDGDGADIIAELHAANPNAQVVVLTSSIDPAAADRAMRQGAAAVLSKLDGFDDVLATVRCLQRNTAS